MEMQQEQWMDKPSVALGCPPGLEYLGVIDQLIVKQQIELLELITGWETNNKYRVFNSMGQQVFFASEDSTCFQRQCCGPGRGFTIHITDNNNQEVLRFVRRFKCCAGCCWCANSDCCAFVVEAQTPDGQTLGYVRQRQSGWKPHIGIYSADWDLIGVIRGPCCICSCPCCGDVEFPVMSGDESTPIGKVCKQWTGVVHKMFTDADKFCVTFPVDLDIRAKATMLGALFLIDFMYFETKKNNNH